MTDFDRCAKFSRLASFGVEGMNPEQVIVLETIGDSIEEFAKAASASCRAWNGLLRWISKTPMLPMGLVTPRESGQEAALPPLRGNQQPASNDAAPLVVEKLVPANLHRTSRSGTTAPSRMFSCISRTSGNGT